MKKELLADLLGGSQISLVFNECFEEDGAIVFGRDGTTKAGHQADPAVRAAL